jgi:hypothetical protein
MKLNYGHLKSRCKTLFPDAWIDKSPTRGIVLVWDTDNILRGDTEYETRIRLVIVDHDPNEPGIVLHSFSSDELNDLLRDAVQTADRDNFGTIFIRVPRKLSAEDDSRTLTGLKEWIKSFNQSTGADYSLKNLKRRHGIDLVKQLETMSAEQRKAVMSLVAAAFNSGCERTREHFREMRSNDKQETAGA